MNSIHVVQIIISILIIGLILLQQRGAGGLGSSFGGDGASSAYRTRRGLEKGVFAATIVLAAAFLVLAVASVLFT